MIIITLVYRYWEQITKLPDMWTDLADSSYLQFFGDDFLRLLLLRYVFCDVVLHLHRSFKVSHTLLLMQNTVCLISV
jgi:Protein of unknown function (DUF3550/UPF0682).